VAIPAVLDLLDPNPDELILDIGAGQGVLAPYIARTAARYTGIDASARLIGLARRRHGHLGRFLVGDVGRLPTVSGIGRGSHDAADRRQVRRSARSDHPEPPSRGCNREALVVGHKAPKVRTQLLGARKVDGVERSKIGRRQLSGRVEDAIADP
jgi:SAM-dependent methyltransferase